MNQILMAAARGARIQELEKWRGGCSWRSLTSVYLYQLTDDNINFRIHPDDEHLRFGPISTALREHAKEPAKSKLRLDLMSYVVVDKYLHQYESFRDGSDMHRSLFLLILSEALAEEGL